MSYITYKLKNGSCVQNGNTGRGEHGVFVCVSACVHACVCLSAGGVCGGKALC